MFCCFTIPVVEMSDQYRIIEILLMKRRDVLALAATHGLKFKSGNLVSAQTALLTHFLNSDSQCSACLIDDDSDEENEENAASVSNNPLRSPSKMPSGDDTDDEQVDPMAQVCLFWRCFISNVLIIFLQQTLQSHPKKNTHSNTHSSGYHESKTESSQE